MSALRTPQGRRVCARCAHVATGLHSMVRWPEGFICRSCYQRAVENRAQCSSCRAYRLAPGLTANGQALCVECCPGLKGIFCPRCGREPCRYQRRLCARCAITDLLQVLLDDGRGGIATEFTAFVDLMQSARRPDAGLAWLGRPHMRRNLRLLATGAVPLTHEGLSTLDHWRSVAGLRDLLMQCGTLPRVERYLILFERWLSQWLATIDDPRRRNCSNASPPGSWRAGCAPRPNTGPLNGTGSTPRE